jgi:hypothetical protein
LSSAETDETGFGGFVTMILGHFLRKIFVLISGQPDQLLFYLWITESGGLLQWCTAVAEMPW